ncbi:hypothetical protein [Corynebacterium sp. A21]|uniref:hypothetical protein n=1 Tax=Corynebacterium sp. A21 TaxID=3457318 RepID=UPI003FCF4084
MRLSKISQGIIAGVVVIWVAVVAVMVAGAAGSTDSSFPGKGALERNVAALETQGLSVSAISMADIYGEEYIAGAIICAGETPETIAANYDVDVAGLELGAEGVPAGSSYLLLRTMDGTPVFDEIDSSKVDLCSQPLAGYFDTQALMPLGQIESGSWGLLV